MTFLSQFYVDTHNVSDCECVVCDYTANNWRALTTHAKNNHKDVWKMFVDSAHNERMRRRCDESEKVKCPLCQYTGYQLMRHMTGYHNMTTAECHKQFPEQRWGSFKTREQHPCCCVFSKREFASIRSLSTYQAVHYRDLYITYKTILKNLVPGTECGHITCVKCGKRVTNIKSHRKISHAHIPWAEFSTLHGLPTNYTRTISRRHRLKLSENKTQFYHDTDRGKHLKSIQSKKFKEDNPGKKLFVRDLNSKLHSGYQTLISDYSYGCRIVWGNITFKSLNEALFYKLCVDRNMSVQYEAFVIPYIDEQGVGRTYTPDFVLNGVDVIEIKCNAFGKNRHDTEKYKNISRYFPITILTPLTMLGFFGIQRKALQVTYHSIGQLVDAGKIQIFQILPNGRRSRIYKQLQCQQHNIHTRYRGLEYDKIY